MNKKIILLSSLLLLTVFANGQVNRRDTKKSVPYGANYQRMEAGVYHSLEIRDGTLWAWGKNDYGQLGDGTTTNRNSPVQVGTDNNWVAVEAGAWHTVAIKANGTLWAWGQNNAGQLGDGTTTDKSSPKQIGSDSTWISISAAFKTCFGIKADGSLWAWGWNGQGVLGDSSTTNRTSPVRIGKDNDWVKVSVGGEKTMALKSNGTLWTWGYNLYGQLGDGTTNNSIVPHKIGTNTNWVMIAAGAVHCVALQANGTLWAWGHNANGQVGDNSTTDRYSPVKIGTDSTWKFIGSGVYHSAAIKSNGTLWTWGWNSKGQIGDGTTTDRTKPTQVGSLNTWVYFSGGEDYSLGLRADGTLWAWGNNSSGQLGDGTNTDKTSPIQTSSKLSVWISISAGSDHTLGLKSDGTLWAWGKNGFGQLGDGTTSTSIRTIPKQMGADSKWVSMVAGGAYFSLGLKSDGTLWAWGYNGIGMLGDGTTTDRYSPVQIGTSSDWVHITAGGYQCLALKSNGTLWAWGYNGYGQLGDGTINNSKSPIKIGNDTTWVAVQSGTDHSLALKSNGTLWTWGRNVKGQLGDGTTTNRKSPIQIGTDNKWVSTSGGNYHSIALKSNGTLWSWGHNDHSQLGDGTTTDKSSPAQIGSDTKWITISAGYWNNITTKSNGTVWAWGDNGGGQYGNGTTTSQTSPIQIGAVNSWVHIASGPLTFLSFGLKSERNQYCGTGGNSAGQLGDGTTTDKKTFTCNTNYSCLSSTYTIGGTSPDYATFTDAVSALKAGGICGPVTFKVRNGTYNEQIQIPKITGASATNTITFVGENGDSSKAVLSWASSSSSTNNYTLNLSNARYVTFSKLGIQRTGNDDYQHVIVLSDSARYDTITHCMVVGATNNHNLINQANIYNYDYTAKGNAFIGNYLLNGVCGVYLKDCGKGLVSGNRIDSFEYAGVYADGVDTTLMTRNTIFTDKSYARFGIYHYYSAGNITYNKIHMTGDYGIYADLTTASLVKIYNNMVSMKADNGGSTGIKTHDCKALVAYNNILIYGGYNTTSAALAADPNWMPVEAYNNNYMNMAGGYTISIGGYGTPSNYKKGNNNYFSNGLNVMAYNGSGYSSYSSYSSLIGSNNTFVNPGYTSLSDLHAGNLYLREAGVNVSGIADDIDGITRNSNGPTIGANELTDTATTCMSGTYTIGGSNPNYNNMVGAVSAMYKRGLCGAVTFNIRDGVYEQQFSIFNKIKGVSASNSITFNGESGDSSKVIITSESNTNVNQPYNYTFLLDSSRYITFKNMTFKRYGTGDFAYVGRTNDYTKNITFSHCGFYGKVAVNEPKYTLFYSNTSADSNLTFTNCRFKSGGAGIVLSASSSKFGYNLAVKNCMFDSMGSSDVSARYFDGVLVDKNYMDNTSWFEGAAVDLKYNKGNVAITHNNITCTGNSYLDYGILTQYNTCKKTNPMLIANNMVAWNAYGQVCCISSSVDSSVNIYNNSTLVRGSGTTGINLKIFQSYGSNTRVMNNVLQNEQAYYCYYGNSSSGATLVTDYNNLYTNTTYFANWNYTDYGSMSSFRTAIGGEAKSRFQQIWYKSNTDLHAIGVGLNNWGTSASSVTDDIDGEARSSTPDVGADEYTPVVANDAGIVKINSPNDSTCPQTASVKVTLRNYGTSTLTNAKITWSVNGSTIGTNTWTGSLAALSSIAIPVTLGNYNLVANNTYNFKIWTSLPNGKTDSNAVNDTLIKKVKVFPFPNCVVGTNKSICPGNSASIGGTAVAGSTYQWFSNPVGFNSTSSSAVVSPTITTVYYLTEKNSGNCLKTDSVTITVSQPPVADAGSDQTVCAGTGLWLGSNVYAGYSYSWTSNPSGFTSTNGAPYIYPTATRTYYLTVADTATGCSDKDTVVITVNPGPSATTGGNQTICYRGAGASVGGTPTPGHTYSWTSKPSGFTSSASKFTANPLVTTTYYLTETKTSNSCTKSDSAVITVKKCCMSGTYTIGGTNPNFANFTDAVDALEYNGVCGAVTFKVREGSYNEQIKITSINGASKTNSITFQGEKTDSSKAVLYYSSKTVGNGNYLVQLDSADWITFKGLTLMRSDKDFYGIVVEIKNGAKGNSFLNNRILGVKSYYDKGQTLIYSYLSSDSGTVVKNNLMKHGMYGVFLRGLSYNERGTVIDHNTIDSVYQYSIEMEYQFGSKITNNTISSGLYNRHNAIFYYSSDSAFNISGNKIKLDIGGIGINVVGCNNFSKVSGTVSNNFVMVKGGSTVQSFGIHTYVSKYVDVVYNNTLLDDLNNASNLSFSCYIDNQTNGLIQNNNFVSGGKAVAYHIFNSTGITSDYNNFYSSGSNFLSYGFSNYSTLKAFQSASGTDKNSMNENPFYTSSTDLHVKNPVLDVAAKSISSITDDIDGETRNATTPDIGADEFSASANDAGITAISQPDTIVCEGTSNVYLTLKNWGSDTLKTVKISWTVNGTSQASYNWKGTLLSKGTLSVKVGSFNFLSGTNHTIKIWTSNPNGSADGFVYNDTFIGKTIKANPRPKPSAGGKFSVCAKSIEAYLTTSNKGSSYSWTATGGSIYSGNGTNAVQVVWGTGTTGKVKVVETNSLGCSDSSEITITINPLPLAKTINDTSICNGTSLYLGATAVKNHVYSWTSTAKGWSSTLANPLDSPKTTTTYYLTEKDTITGCSSSDSVTVKVNFANGSSYTVKTCDSYVFDGKTLTKSGTYYATKTNQAGCDSVITLNLTINKSNGSTAIVKACDSYVFGGNTLTKSGTYYDTLMNVGGCDSILTLKLTINKSNGSTSTVKACDSYVFGGNTLTNSGVYYDTLTNVSGCDSILTLNLTINKSNSNTIAVSACNSYFFNGNTITSSGTYYDTLVNSNGCDSFLTLNLTINKSNGSSSSVSACNSYVFGGNTLTNSGVYYDTLTNVSGCDSVLTLNLTINNSNGSSSSVSACNSYVFSGNTLTNSGVYYDTLVNMNGCDSILTLNLTINKSDTSINSISACDSFVFNGNTLTSSGTYYDTLSNMHGCDSFITLNLTIDTLSNLVTLTGKTLTATQSGATYQWLDCNNGNAKISGATNQSFTATKSGDYAVALTKNSCVDTSLCMNVTVTGTVEFQISNYELRIYPNPTTGRINLEFSSPIKEDMEVKVYDMMGQLCHAELVEAHTQTKSIDLSGKAKGVYLIECVGRGGVVIKRMVLE